MKKQDYLFALKGMGAVVSAFLWSWSVSGASVPVSIANFSFQPPSVTINQGDSVVWTQKDSTQHTSTSDTSLWDSGLLSLNRTFTSTFANAGTFPYHCTPHASFMKGTVVVQTTTVTNPPPTAPTLSVPQFTSGKFQFSVSGTAGQNYIVQASADLTNWSTIQTNKPTANVFSITDSQTAGNNPRFYRVGQQ
jgi:plastocyanin